MWGKEHSQSWPLPPRYIWFSKVLCIKIPFPVRESLFWQKNTSSPKRMPLPTYHMQKKYNVSFPKRWQCRFPGRGIFMHYGPDSFNVHFSGTFTCLEVVFKFKRRLGYYLFHTYVPTCLIVIMSWISFWIKPEAVPARVTLGVTSLLTLSTQHANSQKSLPPVSYIKVLTDNIFCSNTLGTVEFFISGHWCFHVRLYIFCLSLFNGVCISEYSDGWHSWHWKEEIDGYQ